MKKGNLFIGGIAGILAVVLTVFYAQSESTHEFFEGLAHLVAQYPLEAIVPVFFLLLFVVCIFVAAIQTTAAKAKMKAKTTKAPEQKKIKNVSTQKPAPKPISSIKSAI